MPKLWRRVFIICWKPAGNSKNISTIFFHHVTIDFFLFTLRMILFKTQLELNKWSLGQQKKFWRCTFVENLAAIHETSEKGCLQRNFSNFDFLEKLFFLRLYLSFLTTGTLVVENIHHEDVLYQISSKSNKNYRFYKQKKLKIVMKFGFRKKHWSP